MCAHTLPASRALALAFASAACSGGGDPAPPQAPAFDPCVWTPWPTNPVIASGWTAPGDLLINDPCVIVEGAGYRMWYSKGTGLGINHVKVYQGTSVDGASWTLDPAVLVESNSDVTVNGTTTPDVTGVFQLIGENASDFTNGRPATEPSLHTRVQPVEHRTRRASGTARRWRRPWS